MESFNLKTASTYLNNLLLARGLLRDGKQIEFARPKHAEGGSEATMALVINLVHDLVLRRDREQEHKEALATTLRTLRIESTESVNIIAKLKTNNEDLRRQLALAQASERVAKTAQRSAEIGLKTQREDYARLKQSVQQIRASCANDIRKRDVQIQRLKGHLAEQQRGNRSQLNSATIVINPGFLAGSASNSQSTGEKRIAAGILTDDKRDSRNDSAHSSLGSCDTGHALRQETAEFLTHLAQSLSDENDALINIVRTTLVQLQDLQGLSEQASRSNNNDFADTSPSHALSSDPLSKSHQELAREIQVQLANVHSILTSPNYVPVEEVTTRDEEIQRLRAGWDKMESRWREAVSLMHDWRKRMLDGETLGLDELRAGFIGDSSNVIDEDEYAVIEEEMDDEEQVLDDGQLDDMLAIDSTDERDFSPEPGLIQEHSKPHIESAAPELPANNALEEASGNKQALLSSPRASKQVARNVLQRPNVQTHDSEKEDSTINPTAGPTNPEARTRRKGPRSGRREYDARTETVTTTKRVRFSASVIVNTPDADLPSSSSPEYSSPVLSARLSDSIPTRAATPYRRGSNGRSSGDNTRPGNVGRLFSTVDHDSEDSPEKPDASPVRSTPQSRRRLGLLRSPISSASTPLTYLYIDPLQSLKRHSSPTRHQDEPSPKMSVQEKLNLAAAEAEAAAVAAGLHLDNIEVQVDMRTFEREEGSPSGSVIRSARADKVSLRRRTSAVGVKGRPRRRKSTLTPEELEQLMFE